MAKKKKTRFSSTQLSTARGELKEHARSVFLSIPRAVQVTARVEVWLQITTFYYMTEKIALVWVRVCQSHNNDQSCESSASKYRFTQRLIPESSFKLHSPKISSNFERTQR